MKYQKVEGVVCPSCGHSDEVVIFEKGQNLGTYGCLNCAHRWTPNVQSLESTAKRNKND